MSRHRLGPVALEVPDPFVVAVGFALPWRPPPDETSDTVGRLVARLADGGEVEIIAVAILRNGTPAPGGATAHVENRAKKEGRELMKKGRVVWFRKEDELDEGFVGASWYAAIDTHLIMATTTVPEGPANETQMNAAIEGILGTLTLDLANTQ